MASVAPHSDPLAWLHQALEPELAKVDATVEHHYTSSERGSLTIHRQGKVLQTSYFASWELLALREGGMGNLEKQKQAIIDQINRLLNPPKPQPVSISSVAPPARRGRTAGKKAEPAAAGAATDEADGDEAPAEPSDAAEPAEPGDAPERAEEA